MTLQEERLLLKTAQKDLQKDLIRINERIRARKVMLRSMDPKWNAPGVISGQIDILIGYRARRYEIESEMKRNADRLRAVGKMIADENHKRHVHNAEHKEIRRFNRAFTARIHRYEREEALRMVEAHNRALLGEDENERT